MRPVFRFWTGVIAMGLLVFSPVGLVLYFWITGVYDRLY